MEIISLYLFLPFALAILIGMPIAFALGTASLFFLWFSGTPIPPRTLAVESVQAINQFALLALPLFVLTGELLNRCDLTEKLVAVARTLVGWIRGGLAHVNVVASMFFAGISGSAIADAASLGPILIPAMIRERFPPAFSAALTGASSIIGPIIPPSVPMIIVGGQLGISVGGMFAGGIVPGIMIGVGLMAMAYAICRIRGYGEVHPFPGLRAASRDVVVAVPALLVPFVLLGGILSGIFTPTEAGAVGALYTFLVGLLYYRSLTLAKIWLCAVATVRITAGALIIVCPAVVFSRILTYYRVPQEVLQILLGVSDNPVVIVLILIALFLFVGTFMDAVANMIILGPLLMPLCLQGLGMHPIQYGLFLVVGLLIGLMTPPLGLCLFIVTPIARARLADVSVQSLPFLFVLASILLLIAFWPDFTLAIPRAAGLLR